MGKVADAAGIQFRLLNRRKGPAVRGPRAQADRTLYRAAMQTMLRSISNLDIRAASAEDLILKDGMVAGVLTADGDRISCGKAVLTTGTFLNGLIHIGESKIPAGRMKIAEFGRRYRDFQDRDAEVLGVSTDTHFVHLAWRREHPDLRDLPFPMLADTKRELSSALGILHRGEGVPLRATFIVDPEGIVRFVSVNDLSVGRNVDEVLRTLDALQTDELCPCNWRKGEPTLQVA